MMGRHERADKVKALFLLGPGQSFQRRFGIVALVKNEGDVLTPLGQLAITLRQFLGDGLKDGAVVDVAGINLVEQRHMKVGADQKAQTDLTQIDAFLFVMPEGRQGGRIARVNIGEEVRPVINQSAQIELKVLDQTLGELLFDGLNDGTNFFTYINTRNPATLPARGHNKQKRTDLRQVNLGLLVSTDFHVPLMHKVYTGNLTDATAFQTISEELAHQYRQLAEGCQHITLIFDKGNNSIEAFQ